MKVLIAGSHGMIGTAVTSYLVERGHKVERLVRKDPREGEVLWDPDAGTIDKQGLEGFEAVINLATMTWPFRWTAKAKQKMRLNRSKTYHLLAESLAACTHKPRVLVDASGIGLYPPSGDEIITEATPTCSSFLADVDLDGETATGSAEAAGIRVVHLRIPPVLGGAALQRAGFRAGDGQQWMTWVARDELASIIEFALTNGSLSGPVNAVSPNPMRGADFAATVSRTLGTKPGGSMPAFLVRILLGEMGEEFVLASRRVQPAKLLAAGYRFRYPELAQALRHEMEQVQAGATPRAVGNIPTVRT
jgi:hypothetical protein